MILSIEMYVTLCLIIYLFIYQLMKMLFFPHLFFFFLCMCKVSLNFNRRQEKNDTLEVFCATIGTISSKS